MEVNVLVHWATASDAGDLKWNARRPPWLPCLAMRVTSPGRRLIKSH